ALVAMRAWSAMPCTAAPGTFHGIGLSMPAAASPCPPDLPAPWPSAVARRPRGSPFSAPASICNAIVGDPKFRTDRSRSLYGQFLAISELLQRFRIRQCRLVFHRPAVDYFTHGQFHDLAGFGTRDVGDRENA